MKKIINLFIIMLSLTVVAGCRELDHNGDLEGQWQITAIDYADGSSVDPAGEYYYCFYRHVCQLTNIWTTRLTANMVYNKTEATIALQFPRDNPASLTKWGLSVADFTESDPTMVRLSVNTLNSSRLIMTTPTGTILTLRKY